MRQFDVVANPSPRLGKIAPYLVILQSHYLLRIDTTVVAPLFYLDALPPGDAFAVAVEFDGQPFALAVQQLSSVPVARLGRPCGTVERYDFEIARAWERLFTGF